MTYCCICGDPTEGADVHGGACEAALAQYEAEATRELTTTETNR